MNVSEPQELCGPVECKGIEGSDGRKYVLDLVRLGPRDVFYVAERGVAARATAAAAAAEMNARGEAAQAAHKLLVEAGGVEKASAEIKSDAQEKRKLLWGGKRAAATGDYEPWTPS